jgi:hypothetical protein
VAAIDEIVPIGDLVIDRAAVGRAGRTGVAIRNAAVHAARRLDFHVLLRQRNNEFRPRLHAFLDRSVRAVLAFMFEETGDLAHGVSR